MNWNTTGFDPLAASPAAGAAGIDFEYQQMLDDTGNIILLKAEQDADGSNPAAGTWYYPSDLATAVPAPINPKPIVSNGARSIISSANLVVANAAAGAPTVPATANYAEIFVNNADVLISVDGVDPVNTDGAKRGAKTIKEGLYKLESRDEILASKVIVNDATETANLVYVYYLVV